MTSFKMKFAKWMTERQMRKPGMAFSGKMDTLKIRTMVQKSATMQPAAKKVKYKQDKLNGIEVEISIPPNIMNENILVYIHGGGFICGTARTSRGYASQLADEAGMIVYSLTYRLAPEHPFPAGLDDCYTFYIALLQKYPDKKIFLIGESAGANLLVALTLKAKDEGIKLPTALVGYSGPYDFTGKFDRTRFSATDKCISADAEVAFKDIYFPNTDSAHPYISPVNASLQGFPPIKMVTDSGEVLSDDSRLFAQNAQNVGVEVELQEWSGTFHAFPIAGRATKESNQVLKETVQFIQKYL